MEVGEKQAYMIPLVSKELQKQTSWTAFWMLPPPHIFTFLNFHDCQKEHLFCSNLWKKAPLTQLHSHLFSPLYSLLIFWILNNCSLLKAFIGSLSEQLHKLGCDSFKWDVYEGKLVCIVCLWYVKEELVGESLFPCSWRGYISNARLITCLCS